MTGTEPLFTLFAALLGAIIGSFLNVVILRLPQEGASIVFPGSHCPQCKTPLSWYENIPVFSYVVQRGKCRHCKISISWQYPVVESITALLATALILKFGLTISFLGYFVFTAALVVVIFVDIQHQIIPDVISLSGIVLGFLFSFVNPQVTWTSSLLGLLLGGGVLYLVALCYFLLRKIEGMGGGDIKLLAMLGAFLGWQSLLFIIFFSSLTGSIIGIVFLTLVKKDHKTRIPFGPFLSLAALCYLFFSEKIIFLFNLYINGELF